MKKLVLFISCFVVLFSTDAQKAPSHQQWDKLVKKHVNTAGWVNYKGFKGEKAELDAYLKILTNNPPQKSWSDNEQKAYWINAYNAFTVSLIVQHYPVKSIKDIGGKIYKINTPWDIKFINIGGKKYDLNNIEHGILRKKWSDPRIHFAVNCASISCPALRSEAFAAARLDEQLDDAGKVFLRDKSKNKVNPDKAQVSKIFSWFKGDFTKKTSLVEFVNKYSDVKLTANADIDFLDYDWKLNDQK